MNQDISDDVIIRVEDLTIAYEDKPVLWDVELDIKKGILMAIVGPNGAGKSTLIKAMLDLLKPVTGEVRFYDEKYSKVRDKIAYVPQISQLSGGQQQRVILARALVQDAEIYFMDEPFQGVDSKTEKSIVNILKKLRDEKKTVIAVHHDLQTVKDYFDYVTFINVSVIASGPVEEIFTPENIEKTYKSKKATQNNGNLSEIEKER